MNTQPTNIEILEINAKYFVKSFTDGRGRACAQMFRKTPKGKRRKEEMVCNYAFQNGEAARFNWFVKQVSKIHENTRAEITRNIEKKNGGKNAIASGAVQVGSVFFHSWGYEQTNIDFYEVTAVKGTTVTVCQVGCNVTETWRDGGMVIARKGDFKGEPMTKRVCAVGNGTIYINMASYGWCQLWDGKPQSYTTYG